MAEKSEAGFKVKGVSEGSSDAKMPKKPAMPKASGKKGCK